MSLRKDNLKVYRAYIHMLHRCNNPFDKDYQNYGGRGVKVCDEWQGEGGFERFLEHMGSPPSDAHTLDRHPDNNGNYQPGNVRWATTEQQGNNRRGNRTMTLNGRTMTIAQWAKELGCDRRMLWKRAKLGWSDEQTLTVGFGATKVAA